MIAKKILRKYNIYMVVIVSGVSGVGKNTLIEKLLKDFSNMYFFRSATTRAPRPNETIYDFMTLEEFKKKESEGAFYEVEQSHDYFYATQNSELQKIIDNPQNIYIKDIEVHGNRKLRAYFKEKGVKVLSIFLEAPDDVIYERLIKRGESDERARYRISRGVMERQFKGDYDLVIDNLDLDSTFDKMKEYINFEFNKK